MKSSDPKLSLRDVAVIERIVRQSWYDSSDPEENRFGDWISVDQDQALGLIEMIPNRLRCGPIRPLFARAGGHNRMKPATETSNEVYP